MYHVIAASPPGAAFPQLFVRPQVFVAEMRDLKRHGYHGVTLDQVYGYWRRGVALPRRPIVVSFDDGYLSQYTRALPTLRALHWPGVLNLVLKAVRPRGDLSPHMIRTLIASGWEIDSHTLSHADLTTLDKKALRRELVGSRREIRRRFGAPAHFFCYPAGAYNATVVEAVRRAGYRGATTENPGLASPEHLLTLDRVRVEGRDRVEDLERKLRALGA
jgi:peptidoglycan/xylan/chitin deacetylase (PgdA/CDA1 family)